MAKAVRRCFKKQGANWVVGKMCNPVGAKKKYASGKPAKKPPLPKQRRRRRATTPVLDFDGPTHIMPNGDIHTGASHSASSRVVGKSSAERNKIRISNEKERRSASGITVTPEEARLLPLPLSSKMQALAESLKPRTKIQMTYFGS